MNEFWVSERGASSKEQNDGFAVFIPAQISLFDQSEVLR